MGINLFRRKSAAEPVPTPTPIPVPTPQYYCVNIAPLFAELATQRIREQRARDFARYGIYYGQPLEERLRQEELLRKNIHMGERENEKI
ncbi:hypothetical protein FACS189493_1390 [Spirochaetia bacterium]|nr:hypothetical protein FACS189493_1390 [Spirochaetia bacterium]